MEVNLDVVLQNIADGIIVQDLKGNILYANKEALKRTGYKTLSEIRQISPIKLLKHFIIMDEYGTPLSRNELPAALAIKNKKEIYTMMRYKNYKTGTGGWASIRSKPILDKNKKIKYVINLLRFVTDRYLNQRSLKLEYATTKVVAQGLGIDETVTEFMKDICLNLGCSGAIWWAEKNQIRLGKTEKYKKIKEPPEEPEWHTNKRNKTTHILFPVKIGGTHFGSFEFICPDIRPEDSDLLTTFKSVGFQIAEFIQRKTIQESIERQRQGFVALVTHEFKTPLTSIKGYAQILKSKLKNGQKNYLDRIIANTDTLTELVNGLLDIAQARAGKIKFNRRPFNLDKLIDEIVKNIDPVVKHKLLRTGKIGMQIKGDKERIALVISNLISNAIKYSPDAKTIKIKSWTEADKAIVSVQDYGIGIPAEAQGNIFQLFYRAGTPDVTKTSGVGLGLYISATIIKAHGGRIWVKSKLGQGSTFFISLPFNPTVGQIEESFPLI